MKGKKVLTTMLIAAAISLSGCGGGISSSQTPSSVVPPSSQEKSSEKSSEVPSSEVPSSEIPSSSEQKTPKSLLVTPPTKLVYVEGDTFDATGMSVKLIYSDGSEETLAANKYEISGFSSAQVGKCTVTVSYKGFSSSFDVTINKKIVEVNIDAVVFSDKTVTYNGDTHTILVENLPEHVNVTYANNSLKNAGTLDATATLKAEEGFCLVAGGSVIESKLLTAKLKVEAKEITARISNLTYTGEVLTPSVSFTGIISGESVESTVTYSPEVIKDVGEYTATISIDNSNYVLASTTVKFNVLLVTIQLEAPTFVVNDGKILVNLVDPASDFWAYSFDGVNFTSTSEASVSISKVGNVEIFVKAIPNEEDIIHTDSEVVKKSVFMEGNIASYEFESIDTNKNIEDLTGLDGTLKAVGSATASNGRVSLNNENNDSYLISKDLLGYMETSSICIEAVAKVEGVAVPGTGSRFYTILNKTDEYFIGYWVDSAVAGKARLCMVLQSGVEGKPYYSRYYDDMNVWFSLDAVNDGLFHDYAITYDAETGKVSYFMDKILIGSAQRTAGEKARYTGNSLVFGANGNKYDAEHGSLVDFGNVSFDFVSIKNFVPNSLTDTFSKTSATIAKGNKLSYIPSENKSNLKYLSTVNDMQNYGSMTFNMSFAIDPDAFTNGVRYTLANRDMNFQLYVIKDAGKFYGQCYVKTTGLTVYGQDFLDFGDISQIADGKIHTIGFAFNALTGKAYGRIDDIHYDWMEKDFGGTLINPTYSIGVAQPLYVGSAAWGEALPESCAIVSFELTNNPYDILKEEWGDKTLTPIDLSGITFDDVETTYDGEEHVLSINNVPNKVNYQLSDNKLTNAGTKTVEATLTPAAGYVLVYKGQQYAESLKLEADLVIKQKEITASVASIPYSGSVETPVISFVGLVEDTVDYEVAYNPAEVKLVGDYTATITLKNNNYKLAESVINFSVGASPVEINAITLSDLTVTYDGEAHKVECANVPQHVSVLYENETLTNAGTLSVKATITPESGYYLTNSGVKLTEAYVLNATLKVEQKEITASIADLTCTGEVLTPVISLAGVVEGDTVIATAEYNKQVKNPGLYAGTVSIDNANYKLAFAVVGFSINAGSYTGILNDFSFNNIPADRVIGDDSGSGSALYFDDVAYDVVDGGLHIPAGAVLRSLDKLAYENNGSLTVEISTKVSGVYVPETGDKWFPIVCKDNEYFIGFWTVAGTPGQARLCMVVQSGDNTKNYYSIFFDDTNCWLPLTAINDGAYHTYALSYDAATGATHYYRDYVEIAKLPEAPVRGAGETRRVDGATTLYIGAGWGFNTELTIDNYRVTGRALSLAEMKAKTTIVEYDFSGITAECVADVSGNNHPLYVGPNATVNDGAVSIPTDVNANVANSDAFISQSLTVEVITKVSGIYIPDSGEKWFPIAQKDNQFFLAFWANKAVNADHVRLVMILNSGVTGKSYYDVYYDDTNLWLPLAQVNDGNFHQYALVYDHVAGCTHYYYDYIEVEKLNTAPTREAGEFIRQATNVMFVGAGWGANTALEIDALRVSGEALSPTNFLKKSHDVANYSFAALATDTVEDISGNNNDLKVIGGAAVKVEGGVKIPATALAQIPASRSLETNSLDIEVTCIVNGITFPDAGDKWYPILCKDDEFFLGYWVAAGGTQAHLCMVIQSGLPGSTEYGVYFDDIIVWKDLSWINGAEHTYRMTFDPIDGITHYYIDGVEQAKFVDAPVRVPGQARRMNPATPVWVAAGWGFNTEIIFKSLSIGA